MSRQQILAHYFWQWCGADVVTEIAVYDNAGTAALAEISLKDRKILLILPEIDSLGGVL